jgi:DNA-binding transcriptional MerR regulator
MPRPRTGRRYFSYTLSLSLPQIEFLRKYEGANEVVRNFVEELMSGRSPAEAALALGLKTQMETLKQRWEERKARRNDFLNYNKEKMCEKGLHGVIRHTDDGNPARSQTEESLKKWEVYDGYIKEMDEIVNEYNELKKRVEGTKETAKMELIK